MTAAAEAIRAHLGSLWRALGANDPIDTPTSLAFRITRSRKINHITITRTLRDVFVVEACLVTLAWDVENSRTEIVPVAELAPALADITGRAVPR